MGNPARHNSNLNNEYIEELQDIVRENQNEGYYTAEWESDWISASDNREIQKIEIAAEVVCNRREFQGTTHSIEHTYEDRFGKIKIKIYFSWD